MVCGSVIILCCFFFKQKTAYEMRISDWSSDVCSSDLDFRAFRASPQADGAVLAAAAALRQTRRMGEGDGTDLLIVGLSATDYVGHGTGTEGSEMCLQMLALDRSEEHTSELPVTNAHLVCRLLLAKKKKHTIDQKY